MSERFLGADRLIADWQEDVLIEAYKRHQSEGSCAAVARQSAPILRGGGDHRTTHKLGRSNASLGGERLQTAPPRLSLWRVAAKAAFLGVELTGLLIVGAASAMRTYLEENW